MKCQCQSHALMCTFSLTGSSASTVDTSTWRANLSQIGRRLCVQAFVCAQVDVLCRPTLWEFLNEKADKNAHDRPKVAYFLAFPVRLMSSGEWGLFVIFVLCLDSVVLFTMFLSVIQA